LFPLISREVPLCLRCFVPKVVVFLAPGSASRVLPPDSCRVSPGFSAIFRISVAGLSFLRFLDLPTTAGRGYLPSLILLPLVNPECSAAPVSFPTRVISGEEEGNRRESRLLGTRIASIRSEEAYGRPNRISWEQ